MSAAPGRMMMAWVWLSVVTLARLNTTTGTHRDSDGGLSVLEALLSDSELPVGTRSRGGFFPVPVWKFLEEQGGGDEDLGRPQFRCSNSSLSVRFSLIRHSDLRLLGGKKLLLPDGCNGFVRTSQPWLLLNLSYTGCNVKLQISNGTWLHQLTVHYFDNLLQTNITGVATCENPASLHRQVSPLVLCRPTDVIVKLPFGMRLKRVSALGRDDLVEGVITKMTPTSLYVQISTPANMDSVLEMAYSDSTGEVSTMLAACFSAVPKSGLAPHKDTVEEAVPTGSSAGALTTPVVPQVRAVVTIPVPFSDDEIAELWGFEEIPDGPYTTSATAGSTATDPTTSPTTVPSTAAPNPGP